MKLYVVRHGQTDWNVQKRVQGSVDISLNEKGINQAKEVRDKIDLSCIDFCISSPMKRAKQTAQIICNNEISIVEDKRLKERGFGDYEGTIYDDESIKRLWNFEWDNAEHGVETLEQLFERTESFLGFLKGKYPDNKILLVTHGGLFKALYFVINGYDKTTDLLSFFPENGEVYEFNIPIRKRIK